MCDYLQAVCRLFQIIKDRTGGEGYMLSLSALLSIVDGRWKIH